MKGYHVIHPIGWDSFGLPAENAARQNKLHPKIWTEKNIKLMRNQLKYCGFRFDYNLELSTSSQEYYKWTQWLFVKMFNAGMAYQKSAKVLWDPVDKTVLAREQVDDSGRSWRSGAVVENKLLKQWYFKTTAYANDLYNGAKKLVDNTGQVGKRQMSWFGALEGCFLDMTTSSGRSIKVYARFPEALEGVTHVIQQTYKIDSEADSLWRVKNHLLISVSTDFEKFCHLDMFPY